MVEKRSLFQKIFGSKLREEMGYQRVEFISGSNNAFSAWSGNLFDNDIVRSAVRPTAEAVGKLAPKHIFGSGENVQTNPRPKIRIVFEQPNPYMTMQDFLEKMTYQLELNHNSFAYIKRDENFAPVELYPVPYSSVELLEKNEILFAKFRFIGGKYLVVPYDDVMHLRKDFNENDFFGESAETALDNIMEVINKTDQSVINAVKNSAVIKWIMMFKQVLKPADIKLQIKDFTDNYLNITNTGGAAASDPRYELKQVEDKNYVPNAAQMDRAIQRLYSYFGTNDKIVQSKYGEDDWNAYYESKIEPIIIKFSNAFSRAFFSVRERGFGNKIIFETTSLAYASMSTKLSLVSMVDRGALTPNEWRKVLNLGPIEGGDKPIRRLDTAEVKNPKEGNDDGNKDDQ